VNVALEVAREVVRQFGHAGELLKSPAFVAGVIEAGVRAAAARDDEERRGLIQVEVLKLQREWL